MRTFLSLAIVALVFQGASVQCMTWKSCDTNAEDAVFTPTTVTLSPDPPVTGKPVNFNVVGTNKGESVVLSGSLSVEVEFMGTGIFQTEWDLCEKTSCPIKPGEVKIGYSQDLPPIAPPGQYEVKLIARDGDRQQLMCLLVDFSIAPGWFSRKLQMAV